MKKAFAILSLVSFMPLVAVAAEGGNTSLDGSYAGVSGVMTLPQGGSRLRRLGGVAVRGGMYLSDFWAIEGDVSWQENVAGFGVSTLVHAQSWAVYGDLFGYSAFDPFMTVGACGWLDSHDVGQVGPQVGVGAFYHLDDNWSIRMETTATLGLESDVEVVYAVSVGVQYGF